MNTNTKNPAVPTKEMLADWADDTTWNCHGEVREKIAKWAYENAKEHTHNALMLNHVYLSFKEVNKIHDDKECVNSIMWTRNTLTDFMYDLIENEYGAKTRDLIWDCL